jgi:hypothetical protein
MLSKDQARPNVDALDKHIRLREQWKARLQEG